jgi:hypothetical protein
MSSPTGSRHRVLYKRESGQYADRPNLRELDALWLLTQVLRNSCAGARSREIVASGK